MERRPHDRVPRFDTFWQETLARWEKEGLVGGEEAAHRCLEADMYRITPFIWPFPYPGRRQILSREENTLMIKDEWGATVRVFSDHETTPEHISWDCTDSASWRSTFRDAILQADPLLDLAEINARYANAGANRLWSYFPVVEPFECLRKLIGDVEFMVSILEDPDWIADMAEVTTSKILEILDNPTAKGIRPDGLWIYGDMAYNHSTFCSPAQYRQLIWPQHKRMCDWAHDRGMKVIYHSDGRMHAVVDMLIEAGVHTLQPLECKADMDVRDLIPKFGARISFFGNIDVMVLIKGDINAIEEEIATKFSAGMATNGYIFHSDHSIPPQVSWPLYQQIIKLVEKYGYYPDLA